jgi:hypothetical protein
MAEKRFRQHPELIKGIRIQYSDQDNKTRAAVIFARTGNMITVKDALLQRHRVKLSDVRGYWEPKKRASPKNMIPVER